MHPKMNEHASTFLGPDPPKLSSLGPVLKGSWDLVTTVIIRATILITPIKVLIT